MVSRYGMYFRVLLLEPGGLRSDRLGIVDVGGGGGGAGGVGLSDPFKVEQETVLLRPERSIVCFSLLLKSIIQ